KPDAGVFGAVAMLVIVEPAMLSLKRKSEEPPAPVSMNLFPLSSVTTKLTDPPACVSVTVPNPGAGMLPPSHVLPEIWQLVRLKVCAGGREVPTIGPAVRSPRTTASRPISLIFRSLVIAVRRSLEHIGCQIP